MKNLMQKSRAKLGLMALVALAAGNTMAVDLITYDPAGATAADQVVFNTADLTTWLTDGLVAGILVGAILFGIAVGAKYLVKLIRRIGS